MTESETQGTTTTAADAAARPDYRRWVYILLVFAGGCVGATLRYVREQAIPEWNGIPIGTMVENVVGAFILGWIIEGLTRGGPDAGGRKKARLLFGIGMMGGFTTYSALAVDSVQLFGTHSVWVGMLYGFATVIVGAGASFAGIGMGILTVRKHS
ncbi:fluoride efflux transporter FluC [Microbacterium sp. ASV49]|uniref:Fluoride-specific ion channel FluC n=1 Tax=Microbacterium candidum TaxID=3041922 RepID=A0ABT7MTE8_9MICO|nr:CrcB family protein [Microbacterium sp. ASV49]MDL9977713.1 CrcB family protein [Microbacterium sp. ASV49]